MEENIEAKKYSLNVYSRYGLYPSYIYKMFRYWSDKLRGLLVDIRTNKSYNGKWGCRPCLVGENPENKFSACDYRGEGKWILLDCWMLSCDISISVTQPDSHNSCVG